MGWKLQADPRWCLDAQESRWHKFDLAGVQKEVDLSPGQERALVDVPGNSVELNAEAPLPESLRLMDR